MPVYEVQSSSDILKSSGVILPNIEISLPQILVDALIPWVVSLGLISLAEALTSPALMMIGTGIFVVFTVSLTAGALALIMQVSRDG